MNRLTWVGVDWRQSRSSVVEGACAEPNNCPNGDAIRLEPDGNECAVRWCLLTGLECWHVRFDDTRAAPPQTHTTSATDTTYRIMPGKERKAQHIRLQLNITLFLPP